MHSRFDLQQNSSGRGLKCDVKLRRFRHRRRDRLRCRGFAQKRHSAEYDQVVNVEGIGRPPVSSSSLVRRSLDDSMRQWAIHRSHGVTGTTVSAGSIASQSSGRAKRRRGMVRHALCRDRAHTFDCRRNKPGSLRREGQGAPKFAQKSAETHVAGRPAASHLCEPSTPGLGQLCSERCSRQAQGFELLESASISHSVQETSCNSLANK